MCFPTSFQRPLDGGRTGWGWTQYIGFENLYRCTPSHASLDISYLIAGSFYAFAYSCITAGPWKGRTDCSRSQYCLKLYIILNIKVEYVQHAKIRVSICTCIIIFIIIILINKSTRELILLYI